MGDHIVGAEIMPLEDKHYGTRIRLALDNGEEEYLTVWISGDTPSDEALKEWGTDRAGWEANIEVEDCWDGTAPIQFVFPCDSHYQSQYELEVCQQIVDALNGALVGKFKRA